jgi:hypothetical protein
LNTKHRLSLLFISFSLFLVLLPIQSGQGVVLPFKETFDAPEALNSWSLNAGEWFIEPLEKTLNGKGTTTGWDNLWYINQFNESEFTISFRVFLQSGYGDEQFHVVLDYDLFAYRVELGSQEWASHYIITDTSAPNIDLPVVIKLNDWTQVHLTVSPEGMKLWINNKPIYTIDPIPAPKLHKFAFGVFKGSYARFDDLVIEQGSYPPENVDNTIFSDDFMDYNLWNRYTQADSMEVQWSVENDRLKGDYPATAPITPPWGWLHTTGFETLNDLFEYTITVEFELGPSPPSYSYLLGWRFNVGSSVHFICYSAADQSLQFRSQHADGQQDKLNSYPVSKDLTFGKIVVVTQTTTVGQTTRVFLREEYGDFTEVFKIETLETIRCGNVGFGLEKTDNSGVTVYWDNLLIEGGYHPPETGGSQPIDMWGVSVGDTFSYRLSTYEGSNTTVDLGRWFSSYEMSAVTPFLIEKGDELTLEIVSITEKGIEVKVFLDDTHVRTSYTLFFFLPIYNMADYKFNDEPLVDEGDSLRGKMFGTNPTGVVEGELVFYWSKSNGVLESVELVDGQFPIPGTEEVIDEFFFELIAESSGTWAVSVDDEFTYTLSMFSGESSSVNLGSWFGSSEMSDYPSLFIQEGDKLTIKVFTLSEYRIEVEVFLNGVHERTSPANFLFLSIDEMDTNQHADMELVEIGEFYVGKMFFANNVTGTDEGEIEFSWSKSTGALEKAELLSGSYPSPEGMIDTFLLELTSSLIQSSKSDTDPSISLTPGWELVICFGVLFLLHIKKR